MFIEQPAGVGFSYTTSMSEKESFNDFRAANDNLMIIKEFLKRFPERSKNHFYISSEVIVSLHYTSNILLY